jgi:hypothetical protein
MVEVFLDGRETAGDVPLVCLVCGQPAELRECLISLDPPMEFGLRRLRLVGCLDEHSVVTICTLLRRSLLRKPLR